MSDDFDDFELDDDTDLASVPTSTEPAAGTYLVTIAKMEKKARRDGNGNYINVQFRIDDVLDESLEKVIGRSLFDIYNLGADALWKIKGLVVACVGEEAATGNRIPNLTDKRLVLDAFTETYQGRENLRTRKYRPADKWVGLTIDMTAGDPEAADKPREKTGGPSTNEVEI